MFEIAEKGTLVVSGNVRIPADIKQEILDVEPFEDHVSNSSILPLNTKDFYKELRLKGYHYKELFRKVVYANVEGTFIFSTILKKTTLNQIHTMHVQVKFLTTM